MLRTNKISISELVIPKSYTPIIYYQLLSVLSDILIYRDQIKKVIIEYWEHKTP